MAGSLSSSRSTRLSTSALKSSVFEGMTDLYGRVSVSPCMVTTCAVEEEEEEAAGR
jgi:hypothetical protein